MTDLTDPRPLINKSDENAVRTARYEKRHTADEFLDIFYPGWRKTIHSWPTSSIPCECAECEMRRKNEHDE